MTNAGILIRVSTTRQGEQGTSVATQRADCTSYAERQGWQVSMVEEDHQTGTNFNRPGYRRLADAAQRGEIDALIIYDISRFGRNAPEALMELRAFDEAGCEIHSVSEGKQEPGLIRGIHTLMADEFSRKLSEKVKRAATGLAETGHWLNLQPFGYDLVPCTDKGCSNKKLSPNQQGALITESAQRFDAGTTLATLRDWLRTEHGLTVDTGWVRRRLSNPAYVGDVIYGRCPSAKIARRAEIIITRDAHKALIERDVFDRIQTRFRDPRAVARPTAQPYDGLVFCGGCASLMYRNTSGGHYYYVCGNRRQFKTCDQPQTPLRRLEAELEIQTAARFPTGVIKGESDTICDRLLAVIEPDIKRLLKGATDVRGKLTAEIKKLEGQREAIFEARLEGLAPDIAARKMQAVDTRIQDVERELKTLKNHATGGEMEKWERQYQARFVLPSKALAPMRAELLRLLVARITVTDGAAVIGWTDYAQSLGNVTDGPPSVDFTYNLTRFLELAVAA